MMIFENFTFENQVGFGFYFPFPLQYFGIGKKEINKMLV